MLIRLMDALSKILSFHYPQTALDVRCHFGAPWVIDHPPVAEGVVPYHLLTRGEALLRVAGGKEIELKEGDVVIIPHGAAHLIYSGDISKVSAEESHPGLYPLRLITNAGDGAQADVLCGEFRFGADARLLLRSLPSVIVVPSNAQRNLRALIEMLQSEAELERPGAAAILSKLSSALFALLLRAWIESGAPTQGMLGVLAEKRLQAAFEAMVHQPGEPWTLETLAEKCFVSRATFARIFAKAAGMPPAEMLTQIRMQEAARLLAGERAAIAGVAEAVGYQSEAAFSRAFSRHHGVGPGEFRRKLRQL